METLILTSAQPPLLVSGQILIPSVLSPLTPVPTDALGRNANALHPSTRLFGGTRAVSELVRSGRPVVASEAGLVRETSAHTCESSLLCPCTLKAASLSTRAPAAAGPTPPHRQSPRVPGHQSSLIGSAHARRTSTWAPSRPCPRTRQVVPGTATSTPPAASLHGPGAGRRAGAVACPLGGISTICARSATVDKQKSTHQVTRQGRN